MKNKNKGFTLIELLAVIVILGIILTIVVTNVVKYINDAKTGAFKDTYAKVLKDVSNKIALSDIDDNENVACNNVSDCASEYGVSENDIDLIVSDIGNEQYYVQMTGKGSYANISLTSSTKPDNAGLIGTKSLVSTINSDGEIKASNDIATVSDLGKALAADYKEFKTVGDISSVKDENGNETFYNYNGTKIAGVTISKLQNFIADFNLLKKLYSLNNEQFEKELSDNYTCQETDNQKYITCVKEDRIYKKYTQNNNHYYYNNSSIISGTIDGVTLYENDNMTCKYKTANNNVWCTKKV